MARPTETAAAEDTFQFMRDDMAQVFGWPITCYTDQGTHFTSTKLTDRTKKFGVTHIFAAAAAPWSVGLAERMVQMMMAGLRALAVRNQDVIFDWDLQVGMISQALRSTNPKPILGHSTCLHQCFLKIYSSLINCSIGPMCSSST